MHALFSFHLLSQLVGGAQLEWVDAQLGCRWYLREGSETQVIEILLVSEKMGFSALAFGLRKPKNSIFQSSTKSCLRVMQKATSLSVWVSLYPVADEIHDTGSAGYIMWVNCEVVCCLPFSGSLNQHSAIFQSGHNTLLTWLSVFHGFLNRNLRELRYSLSIKIQP